MGATRDWAIGIQGCLCTKLGQECNDFVANNVETIANLKRFDILS